MKYVIEYDCDPEPKHFDSLAKTLDWVIAKLNKPADMIALFQPDGMNSEKPIDRAELVVALGVNGTIRLVQMTEDRVVSGEVADIYIAEAYVKYCAEVEQSLQEMGESLSQAFGPLTLTDMRGRIYQS